MTDHADALKVRDGAQLSIALTQPGGQIVVNELLAVLSERIDVLLNGRVDEGALLIALYEARGLMRVLGEMGDKMKLAEQIAEKEIRLRLRTKAKGEDNGEA